MTPGSLNHKERRQAGGVDKDRCMQGVLSMLCPLLPIRDALPPPQAQGKGLQWDYLKSLMCTRYSLGHQRSSP